jgi:hypothetical protein
LTVINPFCIYNACGVKKTHLLGFGNKEDKGKTVNTIQKSGLDAEAMLCRIALHIFRIVTLKTDFRLQVLCFFDNPMMLCINNKPILPPYIQV